MGSASDQQQGRRVAQQPSEPPRAVSRDAPTSRASSFTSRTSAAAEKNAVLKENDIAVPTVRGMDTHQGIDLSSLGGPPLSSYYYCNGPNDSTTRMPFHGGEYLPQDETAGATRSAPLPQPPPPPPPPPQMLSPEIIDDGARKDRGQAAGSYLHLLGGSRPDMIKDRSSSNVRAVSFGPPPTATFPQQSPPLGRHDTAGSGWTDRTPRLSRWCMRPRWHSSFTMYICFVFGFLCAVGHHIFYSWLDGQVANNQSEMLRYGTFLAYATKASYGAAIVSAFKQRVWVTVRSRFMSISGLDSMFAGAENMLAMLNLDFLRDAKGAFALVLFAWLTPLIVILTANTLLVEPKSIWHSTTCAGVRTLNFSFESTNSWRTPTAIEGLYEIPLSLWNTTKRSNQTDSDWFDYYTGPGPGLQQTATLAAFMEEVIPVKNASASICGAGWNCTFVIEFTAPGYNCTEMGSGVGSKVSNLQQESGEAVAPFGIDIIIPEGDYSYYAFASGGEYSSTQLKDVGVSGIPTTLPPYPDHFGALRTEPVIWIGYAVVNNPNQTQPLRNESGWGEAFTPKVFACEHRETAYVVNFTYVGETQSTKIISQKFGAPIINTTFQPGIMANDGTQDNTTATPESNYVYPTDTAVYRKVAAYHSLGKLLRTFINGTVTIADDVTNPIENTEAIQTKVLDSLNNYFPHPDLAVQVQSLYQDIILSLFSNPQFVEVVWAAQPDEQSGTLLLGGGPGNTSDYAQPCRLFRTANAYSYNMRELWIVYAIATAVALASVVAGTFAIIDNGGVTRNTHFSSIVAATRGPALEKIAWQGPLQDRGDVPPDVKKLRLGYGVLRDIDRRLGALDVGPDPYLVMGEQEEEEAAAAAAAAARRGATTGRPNVGGMTWRSRAYSSGYLGGEMRCGFGLKGDVDQRHREGSLFHQ